MLQDAASKEMKNPHKTLFGKSEGNRPFGRTRRRKNNNIKMYIR
jgi:hypothetical protein